MLIMHQVHNGFASRFFSKNTIYTFLHKVILVFLHVVYVVTFV